MTRANGDRSGLGPASRHGLSRDQAQSGATVLGTAQALSAHARRP